MNRDKQIELLKLAAQRRAALAERLAASPAFKQVVRRYDAEPLPAHAGVHPKTRGEGSLTIPSPCTRGGPRHGA